MEDLATYCDQCGEELPLPKETIDLEKQIEFNIKCCKGDGHKTQADGGANFCAACCEPLTENPQ